MAWSEDSIHRWLGKRARPVAMVGALGHDGAILKARGERPVLCVDACIEGVHFEKGAPKKSVGEKAAGRSLSDLAACAAVPRGLLLALRAPERAMEKDLKALIQAVDRFGTRFGAPLVGGDLSAAPGPMSLTVSALGGLPGRRKPVARSRGKAGQVLLLTGSVGGSRLGRHLRIAPRLEVARFLFEAGATAMMDISDGLALDLSRLARASQVRAELEQIPIHRDALRQARLSGKDPLEHALLDGEDHELLVSMKPAAWNAIATKAKKRYPGLQPIGRFTRGQGLGLEECLQGLGRPVSLPRHWAKLGWLHGSRARR